MTRHWHGSVEQILYTALATMIAFQVIRHLSGWLVTVDNAPVSAVGKSIGGLFSFPAQ